LARGENSTHISSLNFGSHLNGSKFKGSKKRCLKIITKSTAQNWK